jgi:gamma-glutamylcyclotransferase (GGCT)/AIG2-like uncharacterized protein YtfP
MSKEYPNVRKMELIAVYGTLRKGHGNWKWHLNNRQSHKIADFTLPAKEGYAIYHLGGFPGVIKDENPTDIKMELYLVSPEVARGVDRLEGYSRTSSNNTFYDVEYIETPYGTAATYIFQGKVNPDAKIVNGDFNNPLLARDAKEKVRS